MSPSAPAGQVGTITLKDELQKRLQQNAESAHASASVVASVEKLAQELSSTQICILSLIGRANEFKFATARLNRVGLQRIGDRLSREILESELRALASRRLIDADYDVSVAHEAQRVELTELGKTCFNLLGLEDWPRTQIQEVLSGFP